MDGPLAVELFRACQKCNTPEGETSALRLLKDGADCTQVLDSQSGDTCLTFASFHGSVPVVRALLEAQADVNTRKKDGASCLLLAIQNSKAETAKILLGAKADPNLATRAGVAPLGAAAMIMPELAPALLAAGANPNCLTNAEEDTPLTCAAFHGNIDLVRILIDAKAEVNRATTIGTAAIGVAAGHDHKGIVLTLLEAGANPNTLANNKRDTVLTYAAFRGWEDVVDRLLAATPPVEVNHEQGAGCTALGIAAAQKHQGICLKLLNAKANPDCLSNDTNEDTALHFAAYQGLSQLVKPLIVKGARVNRLNKADKTALDLATLKPIIDALVAAGGKLRSELTLPPAAPQGPVLSPAESRGGFESRVGPASGSEDFGNPKTGSDPIPGLRDTALMTFDDAVQHLVKHLPTETGSCVLGPADSAKNKALQLRLPALSEHPQQLSHDEAAALALYTTDGGTFKFYTALNENLRVPGRKGIFPYLPLLKLLLSALSKLPRYPSISSIWRAMSVGHSQVQSGAAGGLFEDKEFHWWNFVSCTTTLQTCESFLGPKGPRTLCNIHPRSGVDITKYSVFDKEREVLIPPGARFRVKSVMVVDDLSIVQLEEDPTGWEAMLRSSGLADGPTLAPRVVASTVVEAFDGETKRKGPKLCCCCVQ